MKTELKQHTRWAYWEGDNRWTLGLTPTCTGVATWLRQTYQICGVKKLPSGTIAVRLYATPKTNALLMELPKPRGGSRHECNRVHWNE